MMRKIAGYLTKNRSGKDQKIAQSTHENEYIKPRKTFWRNSKQFLSITPLLFTEDYIISKLNFDDYTCLRPFLSEQDYSKLLSREEDDNPCLVKFYFRKGGKNSGRM